MNVPVSTTSAHTAEYRDLRKHIAAALSGVNEPLFVTDVSPEGIYEAYLSCFQDPAERQHHTCSCCKGFLQRYAGLAIIGEESASLVSPIWHAAGVPGFFSPLVTWMQQAFKRAKVLRQFLTNQVVLGTPCTGVWTHLHCASVPRSCRGESQTVFRRVQEVGQVGRALGKYQPGILDKAITAFSLGNIHRAEIAEGPLKWLRALHDTVASGGRRENHIWRAVATAPTGFCHITSSVLGTFLDDLKAGVDFDTARNKFNAKVAPLQYQRPKAAPTVGNIKQAETLVAKLGIASALKRRFAKLEDIREFLWRPPPAETKPQEGVFGHLIPKGAVDAPLQIDDRTRLTWEKFHNTVLSLNPTLVEFRAPARGNYSALVTGEDPDAPNILKWDNPVSWFVVMGGSYAESWGLMSSCWYNVSGITQSPDAWGNRRSNFGPAVHLLLESARAKNPADLALFPEILREELHPVRATIEAFSQRGKLVGAEDGTACGYRLSAGCEANLRVTFQDGTTVTYCIDRMD